MKHFPILQGLSYVVELPEGATDPKIVDGMLYYRDYIGTDGISLPPGTWQIVGMLPDVTESEAAGMVQHKVWGQERGLYRNYLYHEIQARHIMKETALESLESAIAAAGGALSRERCLLLRRVEG